MSNSGFTKKRLDLTITLGAGQFGETVGDTVTLSGLRMTADMASPTGDTMSTLQMRIFGLPQDMLNRLTVIGPKIGRTKPMNRVQLAAGDDINGMSVIFEGVIWTAWADYSSAPDVAFNVIAQIGLDLALKPVNAKSYKGSADVAGIMADLAKDAGLSFFNNGVKEFLSNPYFPGTVLSQISACANAADILYEIYLGSLTIWPKNGVANNSKAILISPSTGMVGYPALSSTGMNITTLFNPKIRQGGLIEVDSSIQMATGTFIAFKFSHSLSSEVQNGPWFTNIDCTNYGV